MVPKKITAGLVAAGLIAAASPYFAAVASRSGNDAAAVVENETRRGATSRLYNFRSISDLEHESTVYELEVWQEGYADGVEGAPPARAAMHGGAMLRAKDCRRVGHEVDGGVMFDEETCSAWRVWRGDATSVVPGAESWFGQDPALATAEYHGTLRGPSGECRMETWWSSSGTNVPYPSEPYLDWWTNETTRDGTGVQRRQYATPVRLTTNCFEHRDAWDGGEMWINAGSSTLDDRAP